MLDVFWTRAGSLTVRQFQLLFPELAYTTLMTTLDRLYRKGILRRDSSARAFTYRVRCSKEQWLGELASDSIAGLLQAFEGNSAILSTLVSAVGQTDIALLDELETLVRKERRRLRTEVE